ncbi:hypothetical protein [Pseudomonas sp. NPDC089569]|uniref:hypothetical protein n=1 Tax=Pseudomonas sp. NPDC089569 TaxID=3390722 RepID=UPI003CFEB558
MTFRSVLVFEPGFGVASSTSGQTALELVQYVLGQYESLHKTIEVKYPAGKAKFVADVLCNGYSECLAVSSWDGVSEVVPVDFDVLEPTPDEKLDHATFHDHHAYRLIVLKFAENLGG